ncbi:acyltransferase domain-containing protein [Faecalimonas umbilicata]|uniref:acyltransferase domain-containing protein n=1 Tax=Faecalimonas umbilicata TaxID=1912855 RepID=UPI0039968A40
MSRRVYRDTFYDLTLWCENCYKAYGEYGIAQYDWFCRHLDMSLFRLGRLEFERIPSLWEIQTDGISVHKGDPVISVHIPQGEKLELDACLDSFRQAEQFWKEKQVYLCHSWLLYPGLKEIMKPESNILQFQTLFHIVAVDFEGREAEERIFGELGRIPEAMQRTPACREQPENICYPGRSLGADLGYGQARKKTQIQQIIFTHGYRNTQKNWLTQQIIFFGIRNFPKKKSYLQPAFLIIWKKRISYHKRNRRASDRICCRVGTGKPILGFLAEYDALPGLTEPVCTYQPLKTPGHGCDTSAWHSLRRGSLCLERADGKSAAFRNNPGVWLSGRRNHHRKDPDE